jgi:hypothetical protein
MASFFMLLQQNQRISDSEQLRYGRTLYIVAIVAPLRSSWIAQAVFVVAAPIWLIPDQRIEKRLAMSRGPAVEPQ